MPACAWRKLSGTVLDPFTAQAPRALPVSGWPVRWASRSTPNASTEARKRLRAEVAECLLGGAVPAQSVDDHQLDADDCIYFLHTQTCRISTGLFSPPYPRCASESPAPGCGVARRRALQASAGASTGALRDIACVIRSSPVAGLCYDTPSSEAMPFLLGLPDKFCVPCC